MSTITNSQNLKKFLYIFLSLIFSQKKLQLSIRQNLRRKHLLDRHENTRTSSMQERKIQFFGTSIRLRASSVLEKFISTIALRILIDIFRPALFVVSHDDFTRVLVNFCYFSRVEVEGVF